MGQLVFQAALGGAVNLIGPNISATTNFTLPGADGTNGQALTTNGSGVLGFSSIVSGAAGSNTQIQFNNGGNFGASSSLTWDGSTFSTTGLSASGAVTLSGGTANGVTYLNGSKVLTSGSALVFDGSNLGVGVTPSAWASTFKAIQLGAYGIGWNTHGSLPIGYLNANCYYNGSNFIYTTSSFATQFVTQAQNGSFQWNIAPSGTAGNAISFTQAMTLDASGRLLVGSSSSYAGKVQSWGAVTANAGTPNLAAIDTTSMASGVGGELAFIGQYTAGDYAYMGSIRGIKENGTDNNTACALTFYTRPTGTAPSERARIDSSGNLLVGTTSGGLKTNRSMGFLVNGACVQYISHSTSDGSGDSYVEFGYNGTKIGSITQSGTTAVLYNVTSDQRLKENIVDAPEFGSVIDSIQVRSFDWITDQTHQRAGFIAQELVTVAPEAVNQPNNPEDMMAVDYSKLVPMLVKEIQSLRQRLSAANL